MNTISMHAYSMKAISAVSVTTANIRTQDGILTQAFQQ